MRLSTLWGLAILVLTGLLCVYAFAATTPDKTVQYPVTIWRTTAGGVAQILTDSNCESVFTYPAQEDTTGKRDYAAYIGTKAYLWIVSPDSTEAYQLYFKGCAGCPDSAVAGWTARLLWTTTAPESLIVDPRSLAVGVVRTAAIADEAITAAKLDVDVSGHWHPPGSMEADSASTDTIWVNRLECLTDGGTIGIGEKLGCFGGGIELYNGGELKVDGDLQTKLYGSVYLGSSPADTIYGTGILDWTPEADFKGLFVASGDGYLGDDPADTWYGTGTFTFESNVFLGDAAADSVHVAGPLGVNGAVKLNSTLNILGAVTVPAASLDSSEVAILGVPDLKTASAAAAGEVLCATGSGGMDWAAMDSSKVAAGVLARSDLAIGGTATSGNFPRSTGAGWAWAWAPTFVVKDTVLLNVNRFLWGDRLGSKYVAGVLPNDIIVTGVNTQTTTATGYSIEAGTDSVKIGYAAAAEGRKIGFLVIR